MSQKLNPHVSVDCVVFGFDELSLKVLLIDRNKDNNAAQYSSQLLLKLPGSLVYDDEDIDTAAVRVLCELTGLENIYLQQFHVFGSPNRLNKTNDLAWLQSTTKLKINRVVTIAYYSLIKLQQAMPVNGNVLWHNVSNLPELAFDHKQIVEKGLQMLRRELHNAPIAFELLPKAFTIRQLQALYEIILGKKLDSRNFRKLIAKWDFLVQLNEKETKVAHKPAFFFKFDKKLYDKQQSNY